MEYITRGRLVAFVTASAFPLYFGAMWFIWPCRQTAPLGRELMQEDSSKPQLLRRAAPCADESSSMVEVGIGTTGHLSRMDVAPDTSSVPNTPTTVTDTSSQPTFVNPWSDKSWEESLMKGSDYYEQLQTCVKRDWAELNADSLPTTGFISAYHKQERIKTLKGILANPTSATNKVVCPKTSEPENWNTDLNAKSETTKDEEDVKVTEVRDWCKANGDTCHDVGGAVHFADVENVVRKMMGKDEYPMTPEFIFTNWVPIRDKLFKDMETKYNLKTGMIIPAVHTYLLLDQFEALRATVGSNPPPVPGQ